MKKIKEKRFDFIVKLEFYQILYAKNKMEAVEQLKATFKDDYNIDLIDDEIKTNLNGYIIPE